MEEQELPPQSEGTGETPAVESQEPTEAPGTDESVTADELLGETEQPVADSKVVELKALLEAVVYVLDEPMPAAQIAAALDRSADEVSAVLKELVEETAAANRGLLVREVAGGYQMSTKPEHHEVLRNFVKNLKQPLKLSQAALETLAVIAYRQPITVPEILDIRGVQGAGVLKTLLDRKLITTAGRKNVVGKPILYRTTKEFLTQFGLKDLSELPSLKEFEEIRRQSMVDEEVLGAAIAEPEPGEPSTEVTAVAEGNAAEGREEPTGSDG